MRGETRNPRPEIIHKTRETQMHKKIKKGLILGERENQEGKRRRERSSQKTPVP